MTAFDEGLIIGANLQLKILYDQFKEYDVDSLKEMRQQFNLAEAAFPVLSAMGSPNSDLPNISRKKEILDKLIDLVEEIQKK